MRNLFLFLGLILFLSGIGLAEEPVFRRIFVACDLGFFGIPWTLEVDSNGKAAVEAEQEGKILSYNGALGKDELVELGLAIKRIDFTETVSPLGAGSGGSGGQLLLEIESGNERFSFGIDANVPERWERLGELLVAIMSRVKNQPDTVVENSGEIDVARLKRIHDVPETIVPALDAPKEAMIGKYLYRSPDKRVVLLELLAAGAAKQQISSRNGESEEFEGSWEFRDGILTVQGIRSWSTALSNGIPEQPEQQEKPFTWLAVKNRISERFIGFIGGSVGVVKAENSIVGRRDIGQDLVRRLGDGSVVSSGDDFWLFYRTYK